MFRTPHGEHGEYRESVNKTLLGLRTRLYLSPSFSVCSVLSVVNFL